MRSFLRYWLPLLIWMLVIYGGSADPQSITRTSRFLVPILRWFNPNVSQETIDAARWVVRKGAHVTEYAILAWLAWRVLQRPARNNPRPWSWRVAAAALVVTACYAATDEFHQSFVRDRTASAGDVVIDTFGGAMGLLGVWIIFRWRRRKTSPAVP
jgi:VanZ family protein